MLFVLLLWSAVSETEEDTNGIFSWIWKKRKKTEDKPIAFVGAPTIGSPLTRTYTHSDANTVANQLSSISPTIDKNEVADFFRLAQFSQNAATNWVNFTMDYDTSNVKYRLGHIIMCQFRSRRNDDSTVTGSIACVNGRSKVLAEVVTSTTKRLFGIKVGGKTVHQVRLLTEPEVNKVYDNVRGATEPRFKQAAPKTI